MDNDGAVDVLVAKDRRLEAAAVEPLAHPRHLHGEIAVADADFGTMKVHGTPTAGIEGQTRPAPPGRP